jgi:hypothetical protein
VSSGNGTTNRNGFLDEDTIIAAADPDQAAQASPSTIGLDSSWHPLKHGSRTTRHDENDLELRNIKSSPCRKLHHDARLDATIAWM